MDPMFLPYSSVNGVPQESKLATYMKRQNESLPVAASLTKNLSTLSLNDSLPSSLKKVVPGSTEFIPRSSPSLNSVTYSSTSPLTVTSHINSSPTPTAPTYQEYVGGTTYFYSAPEATTVANSGVGSSIVQTIGSTNSTGVPIVGGGGGGGEDEQHLHHHRASITLRQPSVTMFPGTPSHAKTAMAKLHQQVVGSGAGSSSSQTPDDTVLSSASYFVSNQLRMEIQHKNNLTLATPDPTLYHLRMKI